MESRRDSTTRGPREPRRTSQQSIPESTVKRSVHGERPVAVSPEAFPQSLYSVASAWPAKLRALAYALTHDLHAKASGELWQEGDLGGSKRCDVRIIRGISDGEGCQIGTAPCHLNLSMFVTPARPTTIECIAGRAIRWLSLCGYTMLRSRPSSLHSSGTLPGPTNSFMVAGFDQVQPKFPANSSQGAFPRMNAGRFYYR